MSAMMKQQHGQNLALSDQDAAIQTALKTSIYPGASDASIAMVLAYCRAAGLDVMQKPVHIVPMWDSKAGAMRDVVMPGIGMYRTQASRTGQFAGMSEPEFGPDIVENLGGYDVRYPEYCRVTVKRALPSGIVAEFTAREYWIENYAVKGGKEKSIAPNAMWMKRPRGQIAKCASAQALRIAFPELGAAPTADEMEGKALDGEVVDVRSKVAMPTTKAQLIEHEHESADAAPKGEQDVADRQAGINGLSAGQKKLLLAKATQAGYNEEELVAKFPSIDLSNINDVLAELRTIAESA